MYFFFSEAFKASVERDAQERGDRKKKNLRTSTTYKERGNDAFKCGCFSEALDWYSKAIALCPDQIAYYSNRAQVI